MNEIVKSDEQFNIIEQVAISGDLKQLSAQQRVTYYNRVCESLALNPYTRPFDYIILNGKLQLYARKDATEQLRKIHGVSITALVGSTLDDIYIVDAHAVARDGRSDQAKGAVSIAGLKGEAKANAIMKAETKAKRRVTLSIVGLGWTDESEVDSIPGAQRVAIDTSTGEIIGATVTQTQQSKAPVVIESQPDPVVEAVAQALAGPGMADSPFDDAPKSPSFKRFQAEGSKTFGKQWDDARHWLIERYTKAMTPDKVRKSSNDMSDDELDVITDGLVEKRTYYQKEFGKAAGVATGK